MRSSRDGRGLQQGAHLDAEQLRPIHRHADGTPAHGRIFFLGLTQIGQHLVAADVEGAEDHRPAGCFLDHSAVEIGLFVEPRKGIRQHELQFRAVEPDAVGAAFGEMRHVDQEAGIHLQRNAHAILGDGWAVAERLIAPLLAGAETDLVGIGGDDFRAWPQVHFAGDRVDNGGIARVDPLDDPRRLPECNDPQRLGDDGDVTLAGSVLDDEAAEPCPVVIQELGGAHGPRHQDGVRRHGRLRVGAGDAAREDPHQPVGEIVEIALTLTPVGIVLAQHARAHGVLYAFDRGFRRQATLDGFAQTPVPALVVGEHAVGLENLCVLAGGREFLVLEHVVDVLDELVEGLVQAFEFEARIVGHELGDDDARLVENDVAEGDAAGQGLRRRSRSAACARI